MLRYILKLNVAFILRVESEWFPIFFYPRVSKTYLYIVVLNLENWIFQISNVNYVFAPFVGKESNF